MGYLNGYGFHIKAPSLMMAALLWRDGLRTLRLVRHHEAKRLQQGIATINLASLPEEIFWMIEDELASSLRCSLSYDIPFTYECSCLEDLADEFMESEEFDDALDRFVMTNGLDPYDPTSFEAFLDSDEFEVGLHLAEEMHFENGMCLADLEEIEYWEQIAFNKVKRKSSNRSMVKKHQKALRVFLDEFGLYRLTYKYSKGASASISPLHAPVSVLFHGQVTPTKRRPRKDTSLNEHSIEQRSFARFIALFRLDTQSRWQAYFQNSLPFGQIRYLVVNMHQKEHGEVVIYQKSLKEVKKHNAAVKRKMQKSKKLEPTLAISHA